LVKESRGSYDIRDSLAAVYNNQAIGSIREADGEVIITGVLSGDAGKQDYTMRLRPAAPGDLEFVLELTGGCNRAFISYASDRDEHFFGFGEQFSRVDMKGRRLPIFVTEQGVGRGEQPLTLAVDLVAGSGGTWYTSYAGVPQYITSRLRSMFLENSEYSVFDFRRDGRVQVQVWSPSVKGHILCGDTPATLIKIYTDYAGRMRVLPDWVTSGAIVGMQGGTDKVRGVISELQKRGTPVAAVWLQDWVGQRVTSFGKQLWWNWEVDRDRYPGWVSMVSDLKGEGIRTMTYASAFLVDVSGKSNAVRNLFKEAEAKGYLVKGRAGSTYMIKSAAFDAAMLDLSNPDAVSWMKNVIKEQVIGAGALGWMADFGESLPYDAALHSGEPAPAFHNRYPEVWARLNREAIEEAGLGDSAVFFTRSGYTRSPGYSTLFWEGDQMVSWDANDGIKSAVTGLLSSGLSGFSLNHSDIGGYTTITNPLIKVHRSKELLMRWMELNAFTTIFRTHEGNLPEANVQFYSDNETYAQFDRCARIYQALAPYRRQLVQEAAATGLPVVRHPFIQYPGDPEVYGISYQQFMLGPDFMVAPVLDAGKSAVTLYLPAGEWVHAWSGSKYGNAKAGSYVSVDAPMGKPAVFYKAGSEAGEAFRAKIGAMP
jgi:alpha-glucosidase